MARNNKNFKNEQAGDKNSGYLRTNRRREGEERPVAKYQKPQARRFTPALVKFERKPVYTLDDIRAAVGELVVEGSGYALMGPAAEVVRGLFANTHTIDVVALQPGLVDMERARMIWHIGTRDGASVPFVPMNGWSLFSLDTIPIDRQPLVMPYHGMSTLDFSANYTLWNQLRMGGTRYQHLLETAMDGCKEGQLNPVDFDLFGRIYRVLTSKPTSIEEEVLRDHEERILLEIIDTRPDKDKWLDVFGH